jgi:hypothetical protein
MMSMGSDNKWGGKVAVTTLSGAVTMSSGAVTTLSGAVTASSEAVTAASAGNHALFYLVYLMHKINVFFQLSETPSPDHYA